MIGGFFMMFDSVLVKVSCSEELLYLHTISRRHKSPYRFAILRDTLEQLEREPGRQIIVADCGCYAAFRGRYGYPEIRFHRSCAKGEGSVLVFLGHSLKRGYRNLYYRWQYHNGKHYDGGQQA